MKVLFTGSQGQLGQEVRKVFTEEYPTIDVTYCGHSDLDITDRGSTEDYLRRGGFSHVINCAAYTNVDRAEEDKKACSAVNIDGIANIARMADELGLKILHISTDYVFDGTAHSPYREGDQTNPQSHYGSTKRKGETALLGLAPDAIVIRTGWLYSPHGRNFVNTILRLSDERPTLTVIWDHIGTPTYAEDLAQAIARVVTAPQWTPGVYHYSNEGVASWYDFASAIVKMAGRADRCRVLPIAGSDYPAAAQRPYYSVLSKDRIKATFNITIPHWADSLARCMQRIQNG